MIATVAYLLIGFTAVGIYSLVLLAVCAGAAYRNGLAEGRRQAAELLPTNVRVLPRQRGGVA